MRRNSATSLNNLALIIIAFIALFQLPLSTYLSIFTYFDEAVTILFILYILAYIVKIKTVSSELASLMFLIIVAAIIGIVSTLFSDVKQPLLAQIMDISYLFKFFICIIGADLFFSSRSNKNNYKVFSAIYSIAKATLIIALIVYVVGLLANLNVFNSERYGLKSYRFIYSSAGMFSQYCIIFVCIMIAGCSFNKKSGVKWWLFSLVIWATTLRVRAFVIIFVCIALYLFIFKFQSLSMETQDRMRSVFKLRYIIPLCIFALIISRNQLIKYFGSLDTARAILLHYGIVIMREYAPLGAGFATFCTESAARYYSPLYSRYGISSFWALKKGGSELTDGYWPAVFAELGIIGTIVMITLIIKSSLYMLKKSSQNKWRFFAALIFIIALLISSTATGSYSSYNNTVFVPIIAIIINLKGEFGNYEECDII